jgi:hypothetical protein
MAAEAFGETFEKHYWVDEKEDWRTGKTGSSHAKRFQHILQSGLWSDVTFIVGEENAEIRAHKLILCTGSQFFSTMFGGQKVQNCYRFPDEPEAFSQLLKVRKLVSIGGESILFNYKLLPASDQSVIMIDQDHKNSFYHFNQSGF